MGLGIFLLPLLLSQCIALTWLTYNNCPTGFTPSNHNTSLYTTNSGTASSLYGNVFSSEAEARLRTYFDQGDLDASYGEMTKTEFMLPFILFGVAFFLLFCVTSCCCIFQKRCPPCESWRRNYVKDPYSPC